MEDLKEHVDPRLIQESPQDLYEQAPCGYMSTLPNGLIVKVNQTFLNWVGHQKEDVVNKKKLQELLSIGGKIFYETHHAPLIKMQGFVNEISYDFVSKYGNPIPVLLNGNLLKDESGKTIGCKYTLFNITDRKKYEKEILLAKKRAEQAAIAKSEFLSTISHEIRTPLNAIIGLSNILNEENTDPKNQEYLNILKFSADNLLALINDILDLSRIESGKVMLEENTFDLRKMLNSIGGTFRLKSENKGVEIKVNLDENLPDAIIGDQLKIGQVFTNLVGNALKFTEKGSVVIEARLIQKTEDKAIIYFSVADTGIGIPKDKLDSIFEEFIQANSEINIKYGGTGLGLSISRKILELYGSRMAVESELGKGSRFYFTLNLKMGVKENLLPASEKITGPKKLAGAKILLCEDNSVNVLIVSRFLDEWEVEYEVAEDGSIAVSKVQENYYDLILMDLQMPVMDGFEATANIRKLQGKRYKQLPILALTAATDTATKEKIKISGMNDYISKPFQPQDFYKQLVKYIPLNFFDTESFSSLKKQIHQSHLINFEKYKSITYGNQEILIGLTEKTIDNFIEYKSQFIEAIQNKDWDQLGKLVHKSKLVIDLLEIKSLDDLLKKNMNNLELNDPGNYIKLLEFTNNVGNHFDKIIEELKQNLEEAKL